MHIAFLGFGEAARAFRTTLATADPSLRFTAWDMKLLGSEAATLRNAITAAGVTEAAEPQALADADWLISAVTADQSLLALEPVLPALGQGTLVIDINSVSPGRKRETCQRVEATGAAYLDMAVMAPVHPKGHRTPVLIAGQAVGIEQALTRLGFSWKRTGVAAGEATAIKMVRSVFVKGLEAITVEALLAAERLGCRDEILDSLAKSYPGLGWPDHAAYVFDRSLIHGTRRAAELRECAATLNELGLTGRLADAIADVQAAMGTAGRDCLSDTLNATIAATSAKR
ncbi:MAG: DUF1932 domain-containing protein [bacterium]